MPISTQPYAENLIHEARKGKRLSQDQRRIAIAFLMATQPDFADKTQELAELFDAAPRTIRDDKQAVRRELADEVTEDDVGLVIADIKLAYRRFVERLEMSLKKCSPGTATYLNHLKLIMEMEFKYTESLQSLGYLPKNLGNLTTTKYEFTANTGKGGVVYTTPVIDAEFRENPSLPSASVLALPELTAEDAKQREALNAEFLMAPLPPPKAESNGETNPEQSTRDSAAQ